MITIIVRSLGMDAQAGQLTEDEIAAIISPFVDDTRVSEGARAYLALAVQDGLVAGNRQGYLSPLDGVTRAQLSLVLYRAENPDVEQSAPTASGATEDPAAAPASGLAPEDQAKADFMTTYLFRPHDSPITGEMVLQNADWYGIPALSQLVIIAAETSLGDPSLGGSLARHNNFGCLRYHGADTPWGLLSDDRIWVAGKDWYSFPDAAVGMAALGRYLKVGADGYYLPILSQDHPDWERFASVYYGRGVSGFSAYVSRLRSIESRFRSMAAEHGVSL